MARTRRSRRSGRMTPQQRKFKAAAKKCKGKRAGSFQSCMRRELRKR